MIVKGKMRTFQKSPLYCPAERPFFVVPSDSEASLASLGTASPRIVRDGVPGCPPEARKCRGTPRLRLGVTKKGSG